MNVIKYANMRLINMEEWEIIRVYRLTSIVIWQNKPLVLAGNIPCDTTCSAYVWDLQNVLWHYTFYLCSRFAECLSGKLIRKKPLAPGNKSQSRH